MHSYSLSFHEFRLRFAFFPIVGTGRIEVARGLVSACVVCRVMAVNSWHIKGRRSGQCIRSLEHSRDIRKATRLRNGRLFEFHRPQSTSTNLERLEVWLNHTPWEIGFTRPNVA
ncbi:hypothetical protein AVEN_127026-1 [Araneus ventricosus]|uniref:Uncharacterized protein n=1 Tax=Araneus ventricosus TaxID=182803 RepID=A0A4Y2C2D6_ARAVE|nr:hypothetical protein AVEN_127026-1 [Araneus ventricosus]